MSTYANRLGTLSKKNQPKSASVLSTIEKKNEKESEKIKFSFELFDRTHPFFNLGETCHSWFIEFLDALQTISTNTWTDFKKLKKYDVHPYSDGSKFEYNIDKFEEKKENAWQFRINKTKGRIHGLFIDNIFYIHWLDPHHNMTDSKGYEKARKIESPLSCPCNQFITQGMKMLETHEKELKELEEVYQMTLNEAEQIINRV